MGCLIMAMSMLSAPLVYLWIQGGLPAGFEPCAAGSASNDHPHILFPIARPKLQKLGTYQGVVILRPRAFLDLLTMHHLR